MRCLLALPPGVLLQFGSSPSDSDSKPDDRSTTFNDHTKLAWHDSKTGLGVAEAETHLRGWQAGKSTAVSSGGLQVTKLLS